MRGRLFVTPSRHWTNCRIANIEVTTFGSLVTVTASLYLNPELLDDRPPFLGISFLERTQCLGCLSLPRENLRTYFGKPRLYRRLGKSFYDRGVELADDILRRSFGSEETAPLRMRERR
jgi:hypothetical protein